MLKSNMLFQPPYWLLVAALLMVSNAAAASSGSCDGMTTNHSAELKSVSAGSNDVIKLTLFVALPLNQLNKTSVDRDVIRTWDRGDEILPGARLAVEDINRNPHLLPGYELELVNINVDLCIPQAVHSSLNAFIPFASGQLESNVVGMLGLFCGRLLRTLSPLASRDEYGLFQLSGTSVTDVRGKREKHTHLNFVVPSEVAYYEAFLSLAAALEWRRVLVLDNDFVNLKNIGNGTLSVDDFDISFLEVTDSTSVATMNDEIRRSEKNIVFVSLPPPETAAILCGAFDDGLIWPHYVWVLENQEVDDLLNHARGNCTGNMMRSALENTILLNAQFHQSEISNEIVTGGTYKTYLYRYMEILAESGGMLKFNRYANVMHDSVWAFALALNQSLDKIVAYNMTVTDFVSEFGRKNLTNMIEANLRSLSFEGAGGRVHFNKDYDIDALVYVTFISDLTSSVTMQTIGIYDQLFPGKLAINRTALLPNLPQDKLPNIYILVPLPVAVLMSTVVIVSVIFTTFLFFLFIKFRRYSEIKATSPYLSLLMFVGTYSILVSTLVQANLMSFVLPASNTGSAVLCGSVIAGNILGINLVFSTLLLRMLRVYRIFSYFGKTGKIWSDKFLAPIVALIVCGDVVLLCIWFAIDPFTVKNHIVYRLWLHGHHPYYEVGQYCSSDNIGTWIALAFGKAGVLFAVVLFLAVKTRKIQRANFKDTKKVNIYIFVTVLIMATYVPTWFLLKETGNVIGTGIASYVAFGATGVLCQLALFAPKVFPPLLRSMGFKLGVSPMDMRGRTIRHGMYNNGRMINKHTSNRTITTHQLQSQLQCAT